MYKIYYRSWKNWSSDSMLPGVQFTSPCKWCYSICQTQTSKCCTNKRTNSLCPGVWTLYYVTECHLLQQVSDRIMSLLIFTELKTILRKFAEVKRVPYNGSFLLSIKQTIAWPDHSPSFSSEINLWIFNPTVFICLHGRVLKHAGYISLQF
jgi:hypothetical protein